MAEVVKKLFSKEIQENLFPDNAFYKYSKLDGGINPDVTEVQIPQAGTIPTVIVDATTYPLPITSREDATVSYSVQAFSTTPVHLQDVNALTVSYDKRKSLLRDHTYTLNSRIAETIGNAWAPSSLTDSNARKTTGTTTRPANTALGLTGTRKQITLNDLAYMQFVLDNQDVPAEGRYCVFPASMYNDLVSLSSFISYTDRANDFGDLLARGIVGEIYGFMVMKRSKVVLYDEQTTLAATSKRAVGATLAVTDNEAAIFWHESFVRRAEGNAKVYINVDKAEYQGTLMSALVRAGGTPSYTNGRGVAVLIQDN